MGQSTKYYRINLIPYHNPALYPTPNNFPLFFYRPYLFCPLHISLSLPVFCFHLFIFFFLIHKCLLSLFPSRLFFFLPHFFTPTDLSLNVLVKEYIVYHILMKVVKDKMVLSIKSHCRLMYL